MSGDEADESSVGDTSYEDEDIPLPVSPFKAGTDEPFTIVLKGGRPWGFDLKGGSENKAPLKVSQVTEFYYRTVNIKKANTLLTLSMLGKKCNRRQFESTEIFFLENKKRHFMQIVS